MRALELFSGIGGLALAAPPGWTVAAAWDQDHAAADTYELNLGTPVIRRDLAAVQAIDLARHAAGAWLLSPPCQPFTRRGRGRDVDDPRCRALLRLIELLPELRPSRVLVENVPGFLASRAAQRLRESLAALGHDVADVEACPTELGAPIRRRREFVVSSADGLAPPAPLDALPRDVATYLDRDPAADLAVPEGIRSRVGDHLPMPGRDGRLGTFTRSYGRAITGAGPVLWCDDGPRYFSPEEILRLHGFPARFRFPAHLDRRTRWRLAGNSLHVPSVRHVASRIA